MQSDTQPLNFSYNNLVLDTIGKMRDAKARKDREQYITYADFALKLLIPYLAPSLKRDIEADYNALFTAIESVNKEDAKNETSKKKEILDLRGSFADAHEAVIMATLSKVGIVKITEEGLIDFASNDLETLGNIIRAGSGLPSKINRFVKDIKKEAD